MNRALQTLLVTIVLFACQQQVLAQMPVTTPKIYGSSPFQDSLWSVDTTNYSIVDRLAPSLAGFTITGITGMAYDPTTYQTFVIMKVSGVSGRVLGTINLNTGVCTQVGNLGDNFASITFHENGQLYGATGDGASVPESLYLIDKTNASKTLLYAMGNGVDGEIINFNRADDMIYHWSGNGTVVFEKFAASDVAYTPVNIPVIGATGGETFGSLYLNPTTFLNSTISSNFRRVSTDGTYSNSIGSNPDDLRGLVMPPQFAISTDTLCEEVAELFIGAGSLQLFDSVVYHWGDGTSSIAGTTGASHVYTVAGDYTIYIELDNGSVRDTFPTTFDIHVNNIPVVSISGSTALCPGGSVTLTGTSGGSSQWYMNGIALAGETTNTYTTNVAGIYNMTKTNLNGCADSSQTSLVLINVPNPTVFIGNDTTVCGFITLDAGNPGGTYTWSTAGTAQTEIVLSSGNYFVEVTDTNGCVSGDTIDIIINPNPVFSLGADSASCVSMTIGAGISGTYLWFDNSTDSTVTLMSSGTYYVMVTDVLGCSSTDTIVATINALPSVVLTAVETTVCTYDPDLTLNGTPSGGTYSGTSVSGNLFDPSVGAGSYDLAYEYTDGNGCTNSDTLTITVDGCAGLEENTSISLSIHPNPSKGICYLETPVAGTQIEVIDLFGKVIYTNNNVPAGAVLIDLQQQPEGTYFLFMTTPDGIRSGARVVLSVK